ncbi:MAG: ABC transporter permease, partial [Rikenellaceae bacterium]
MRELLIEIWMSVRKNKLRTFLTGFSVAWGIFMLVILLGSSNGFKNAAISSFGSQAINSIELYGGTTSKPYMGYDKNRGIKLCNNDLQVLKKEFPEIDEIAANFWFNGSTVTYGKEFIKVWLRGSLPKIEQIEDVKIIKGRFINDSDLKYCRKSIVIDEIMQTILFKEADPLGEKIKVGSSMFTVVGVYKGDATRSTSASFIPLTTGQLIYKANDQHVSQAILTVKNIYSDEKMK